MEVIVFPLFSYDDEAEKVTQYERIDLEDLEKIEIGKRLFYPAAHAFFVAFTVKK